jgi:hypothetical protein
LVKAILIYLPLIFLWFKSQIGILYLAGKTHGFSSSTHATKNGWISKNFDSSVMKVESAVAIGKRLFL